jgi:c(7)-type cytochrome triheme protein
MFEVAWCVMLYTMVLALEFSPLVFERLRLERPLRIIRAVYIPLVIAGVLLSTLHQSSLGTLYVIAPDKLHGLWYTPLLPLFFFLSAIAGGLAMTIFESFMSWRAFGKRLEADLLDGLARAMVVVLAVYAAWKAQDLAARDRFALVFQVTPESVLFWGEMVLGALVPMVMLAFTRVRRDPNGLFLAATLTIMGFVVNRLNVAVTGMAAASGVLYLPSWMEFAITASIVAAGFVLFGLAVKHLPVFPEAERPRLGLAAAAPLRSPAFNRGVLAAWWLALAFGVAAVGASMARNGHEAQATPLPAAANVRPELAALPAPYTFPASADSPGPVTFRHETHVGADRPACATCHRGLFSINSAGTPIEGEVGYDRVHEGDLCASCHDGTKAFAVADACETCHRM